MRPAQLTPENTIVFFAKHSIAPCFNEAGAINAGKPGSAAWTSSGVLGFNEAGAINAGKRQSRGHGGHEFIGASMRPAQLTPENATRSNAHLSGGRCFNEAGAINAGKQAQH